MPPDDHTIDAQQTATAATPARGGEEAGTALAFGRYRLFSERRLLLADDKPVELGSRAFEAALALAEARGALVTREQLRQRLWPSTFVEPHNLDTQISTLRKALGPDRDLIRTEIGRGWRLAAPVRVIAAPAGREHATNIPVAVAPLIGRDDELRKLPCLIDKSRLLTLTGPGGIGKTRLGLEAARLTLGNFADGVWLVELASLTDSALVPAAIARVLGIALDAGRNPIDQLAATLCRRHLLLVIDNSEHLVEAVARSVEALLRGAPRLHVLATSREPLETEGELIFRVNPLAVPEVDVGDISEALKHSAVELFVERTQAADQAFALDARTLPAVSKICQHLDGIPLALELAAGCIASIGVHTLADRLDDRFALLNRGRRLALPRHQTLAATLDWSYELLTSAEQAVFRRVAIFAGSFTLDGASAIAASDTVEVARITTDVAGLVRKSLISADVRGPATRYRLLDTTRAYAREKLARSGEFSATARRHASYYLSRLENAGAIWDRTPACDLVAAYAPDIDDIHLAVNWAFEHSEPQIGIALAAAAAPLWTLVSILGECRDLIDRGLSHLEEVTGEQRRHEMVLQTALGRSSIWAKGALSEAGAAAKRALELANVLDDVKYQLQALYILWIYRLRICEYRTCASLADQFHRIAIASSDGPGILTAMRLKGVSLHYLGAHAEARATIERVLADEVLGPHRSLAARFGLDQRVAALSCLARVLWLQGLPDQAARVAKTCVDEARASTHANSLCIALCDSVCIVAAMAGDLALVEESASELIECAERHGLAMLRLHGMAFTAWAGVQRGDIAGARILTATLREFPGIRVGLHNTAFVGAQVEALHLAGRAGEGLALIEDALQECEKSESGWRKAELLRIRGEMTLKYSSSDRRPSAERDFREALDLARRQGALSWELRAATSLARLLGDQRPQTDAHAVLAAVYSRFTEGFETADLSAARTLIDSLAQPELLT